MRNTFHIVSLVLCSVLVIAPVSLGAEEIEADHWGPVRPLLGRWEGTEIGKETSSRIVHEYSWVLGDQFLQGTTHAEFQAEEPEAEPEIHGDIGYFSFDPDRGVLVFRQFLSEGYVNTYLLERATGDSLIFVTETTEGAGGFGARLRYSFTAPGEYVEELDLLPPGGSYFTCQRIRMTRVPE